MGYRCTSKIFYGFSLSFEQFMGLMGYLALQEYSNRRSGDASGKIQELLKNPAVKQLFDDASGGDADVEFIAFGKDWHKMSRLGVDELEYYLSESLPSSMEIQTLFLNENSRTEDCQIAFGVQLTYCSGPTAFSFQLADLQQLIDVIKADGPVLPRKFGLDGFCVSLPGVAPPADPTPRASAAAPPGGAAAPARAAAPSTTGADRKPDPQDQRHYEFQKLQRLVDTVVGDGKVKAELIFHQYMI